MSKNEKLSIIEWLKKQFKQTIPEDYELEFDICMKCGRRLPDRKYSTLKAHQDDKHQLPRKKKLKEMMFKYPILSVFISVGLLLTAITVLTPVLEAVLEPIIKKLYPDLINTEKCSEDVLKLKIELYQSGAFTGNHVDEFNRLMKECNVNFFAVRRDPPLFEQDEYKDIEIPNTLDRFT